MSLTGVFSKTFGFVVGFAGFQKARKQAEKALFLSAKLRTPFREHGGCISGTARPQTPILFLRGSHSHEMALLFQKTILPTVIVPIEKEPVRRPTTKKMRKSALALPLFGDIVRRNGLPLFLISSLSVCHPMPCPMRFSGSFP